MLLLFYALTRTLQKTQHVVFTTLSKIYNGVYSTQPRRQFILKKCSSSSTHMSSNINHIITPSNNSYPFIINIVIYCAVNGYRILVKIVNIPPPDQFSEMYTIVVTSGVSKTVQRERIDMDPYIYRFKMDINV